MNKKTIAMLFASVLASSVFAQDATKAELEKTAAAPDLSISSITALYFSRCVL